MGFSLDRNLKLASQPAIPIEITAGKWQMPLEGILSSMNSSNEKWLLWKLLEFDKFQYRSDHSPEATARHQWHMRIPFQLVFSNRHSFLCQDQSPRISVVANLKLSLVICVPERLLIRSGSSLPQGSTVGCRPLYNAFSDHVKRLRTRDIVWWDHNSASDMENRRNLEARMLRGLQSTTLRNSPMTEAEPHSVLIVTPSPKIPKGIIWWLSTVFAHSSPKLALCSQ